VETDYKGIKNFPRLCAKLMIEHPYLYDVLKKCQIEGETGTKEFLKAHPERVHLGAISAMVSKLVSKGQ